MMTLALPPGDTHPSADERIARFDAVAVMEPDKVRTLKGFRTASLRLMNAVGALLDDLPGAADHLLPPGRVHRGQTFGDHGDVPGPDLEQSVTAEGTARAALEVLGLRVHHRREVLISPVEDLSVVFAAHSTAQPAA